MKELTVYKLDENGEQVWEIWTAAEVDEHRKRYSAGSDRKDSAWQTSWDAMAKKTVLKRPLLDGRIRLSIEDLRIVARETEIIDGEPVSFEQLEAMPHEERPIQADLDELRAQAAAFLEELRKMTVSAVRVQRQSQQAIRALVDQEVTERLW